MNDEPAEGKGAAPAARARSGAKEPEKVAPPDEQGEKARDVGEPQPAQQSEDAESAAGISRATVARKTTARTGGEPQAASVAAASADGPLGNEPVQEDTAAAKDISIAGQMIINTITRYAQTMKPGQLFTQAEGMRQQVSLHNAIFAAINTLDADFRPVLTRSWRSCMRA